MTCSFPLLLFTWQTVHDLFLTMYLLHGSESIPKSGYFLLCGSHKARPWMICTGLCDISQAFSPGMRNKIRKTAPVMSGMSRQTKGILSLSYGCIALPLPFSHPAPWRLRDCHCCTSPLQNMIDEGISLRCQACAKIDVFLASMRFLVHLKRCKRIADFCSTHLKPSARARSWVALSPSSWRWSVVWHSSLCIICIHTLYVKYLNI